MFMAWPLRSPRKRGRPRWKFHLSHFQLSQDAIKVGSKVTGQLIFPPPGAWAITTDIYILPSPGENLFSNTIFPSALQTYEKFRWISDEAFLPGVFTFNFSARVTTFSSYTVDRFPSSRCIFHLYKWLCFFTNCIWIYLLSPSFWLLNIIALVLKNKKKL